jgi:hypothetical protein
VRTEWKGRRGTITLPVEVRVSSSGWHDEGYVGGPPEDCREPGGEEEREVVSVTLGGRATVDQSSPHVLALLADLIQEQVDDAPEEDFEWEASE